jgi:hypothetical protein
MRQRKSYPKSFKSQVVQECQQREALHPHLTLKLDGEKLLQVLLGCRRSIFLNGGSVKTL